MLIRLGMGMVQGGRHGREEQAPDRTGDDSIEYADDVQTLARVGHDGTASRCGHVRRYLPRHSGNLKRSFYGQQSNG